MKVSASFTYAFSRIS